MAMTPEGRVKAQVRVILRKWNVWYFMPVSNGMGQVGIPDFICCHNGKFLGIECKAPGKKDYTTPNQERVLAEIKEHGGLALVIDDAKVLDMYLSATGF